MDRLDLFDDVELTRNGIPMEIRIQKVGGAKRVVAPWPRSDSGRYEIRVCCKSSETVVSVRVAPEKIDTDEYEDMVQELEHRLPATIALSLQRAGALAGVDLLPPTAVTLEEEMNRVRRAVIGSADLPGLATILPRIAADPHGTLKTTELWVRRPNVRRPQPAALVRAITREGNIDKASRPRQVVDTRVEYTLDVYENRLLRAYVEEVELRLRHLMGSIEKMNSSSLLGAAEECLEKLTTARRSAPFFEEVGQHRGHVRATMVFVRRPDYRAAFSSYVAFHRRAAVRLWDDRLSAPLENVPALYEAWGTLRVLEALADFAAENGFTATAPRLFVHRSGELFLRLLPGGTEALRLERPGDGTTVRFVPQRAYGAGGKLRSISFQQRPDVAIEIARPDGETKVIIFDPKYKLDSELRTTATVLGNEDKSGELADPEVGAPGRPKKTDIDKMHAYRDSIRDLDGHRVVQYAAILYPGQTVEYAPGLAAVSARPSDSRFVEAMKALLGELLAQAVDP